MESPRYMVKEKGKREKMRMRLESRAVRYEKRLEKAKAINKRGNARRRLREKGKRVSRDWKSKRRCLIKRKGFWWNK